MLKCERSSARGAITPYGKSCNHCPCACRAGGSNARRWCRPPGVVTTPRRAPRCRRPRWLSSARSNPVNRRTASPHERSMNVALRFVQCDHRGSPGTEAVVPEFPFQKAVRVMHLPTEEMEVTDETQVIDHRAGRDCSHFARSDHRPYTSQCQNPRGRRRRAHQRPTQHCDRRPRECGAAGLPPRAKGRLARPAPTARLESRTQDRVASRVDASETGHGPLRRTTGS
jgi:hypothetical protein